MTIHCKSVQLARVRCVEFVCLEWMGAITGDSSAVADGPMIADEPDGRHHTFCDGRWWPHRQADLPNRAAIR
jgi:hypothetical protein